MDNWVMRCIKDENVWTLPYLRRHQAFQSKKRESMGYFEEIKPMLFTLKLLGRLPRNFSKKGLKDFKWYSPVFIYSIIVYCLQTYVSIDTMITANKWRKTTLESSFCITITISYLHNIIIPITYWSEAQSIYKYINLWHSFQDEYYFVMKKCWKPRFITFSLLINTINPVVITIIILINKIFVFDMPFHHYMIGVPTIGAAYSNISFWLITSWEIRILGAEISSRITKPNVNGKEAGKYRKLWIKLVELTTELGNTLGISTMVFSITNIVCLTVGLFAVIEELHQASQHGPGFLSVATVDLLTAALWFQFSEQMHQAANAVGNKFSEKLLKVDLSRRESGYVKEIKLILQFLDLNEPAIEMSGFFKVDRNLILTYLKSSFTYFILLIQTVSMTKTVTKSNYNFSN